MIFQLSKGYGLLQSRCLRLPETAAVCSGQTHQVQPTRMTRPSTSLIHPRFSCDDGVGDVRRGDFFNGFAWIQDEASIAKEQGSSPAGGSWENIVLSILIGMVAACCLVLNLSNAAAALPVPEVGSIVADPDNKQTQGLDSLPTKPGLVERLVEKSKANKAKYDQERLDNYYKRNYKDYFDFLKGRLVNRDPETLTESERGILKWLEKNS